jgi:hypothetical protein
MARAARNGRDARPPGFDFTELENAAMMRGALGEIGSASERIDRFNQHSRQPSASALARHIATVPIIAVTLSLSR